MRHTPDQSVRLVGIASAVLTGFRVSGLAASGTRRNDTDRKIAEKLLQWGFLAAVVRQLVQTVADNLDDRRRAQEAPLDWLKVDSSLIALHTVLAGVGSTIVLERYAQPFVDRGLLVSPCEDRLPVNHAHFLVRRNGAEKRKEVVIFGDWLASLNEP